MKSAIRMRARKVFDMNKVSRQMVADVINYHFERGYSVEFSAEDLGYPVEAARQAKIKMGEQA